MLRPAIKVSLLFTITWIVLKLLFKSIGVFQENIIVPGMLNNLFLLAAISLGLYLEKKKEGFGVGTAFSDLKSAITAGMIYSVLISGFIFFYYNDIHPEFTQNRIDERIDALYTQMERPSFADSLRENNDAFVMLTDEEILSQIKTETVGNLSAKSSFIFSLLGLMILTLTYAIFITVIYQRILFRDYYFPKQN